jgi:hypothetical protein
MLMPSQLKMGTMEFIEVEDIKQVRTEIKPPKTKAQIDRETYEEVLEQDKLEQMISEEQRQKTIKCLLKVMDF